MLRVQIVSREGLANIEGFRYLWAKYVTGFNPKVHCAQCLKGSFSERIKAGMDITQPVVMDERETAEWIYICGVAQPYRRSSNFHLALRRKPGAKVEKLTYNGFLFVVEGAEEVVIPPLPKGFRDLKPAFTTCRNFQFGVHYLETPEQKAAAESQMKLCLDPSN